MSDDSYDEQDIPSDSDDEEAEESDADFFTSKKEQRQFETDSEDEIKLAEAQKKEDLKVHKKKLKKITKDGPFSGKNKVFFDASGKAMSSLEYHLAQDAKNAEESKKEDEINIVREDEASMDEAGDVKFVT